ncbi:hypothetical protein Purlil1_14202 [Purpureocillium lilacinum]|uniref:Uncharacterized protein n=1 Tax=Purpureocillium lilacinum TaxID=33203 RepID=A0ABR0BBZ3_PURLI|nr:hypothetical protein Purlil1_14202 [Purpureocillium lilacinum]
MWAKVAEELQVPWRAAEAMHWQLGEADMAHRAGVVPFSLTSSTAESTARQPVLGPAAYLQHRNQVTHYPAPSSSWAEYDMLLRPPPPPLASVSAPEFIPTLSQEQEHNYYTTGSSHVLIGNQGQPRPAPPPSPDRHTTVTWPHPDSTELPTCSDDSWAGWPSSQRRLLAKQPGSPITTKKPKKTDYPTSSAQKRGRRSRRNGGVASVGFLRGVRSGPRR